MSKWLTDKEEIEEILNSTNDKGFVDSELILETAKKKSSPIHHYFEWDESKAAHEYNLIQARQLSRRIPISYIGGDAKREVPLLYNIKYIDEADEKVKQGYVPINTLKEDEGLKRQVLKEITAKARYWLDIHKEIEEVPKMINEKEVEKVEKELAR